MTFQKNESKAKNTKFAKVTEDRTLPFVRAEEHILKVIIKI